MKQGSTSPIFCIRPVTVTMPALIVVLIPSGYYLWRWYDRSRDVQTTNDAYVRGEITDLSSRVSGYAVDVQFDDGMPVKATDVVVGSDPRDFRMAVEKAEAALSQAKADLAAVAASRELGKSKVAVAEAALRSAEAQVKNSDTTLMRADRGDTIKRVIGSFW